MSWVAVGVGAATVVGGAISADASKSAANTQANAANNATQQQMAMFNTTQGNLAPWMNSGQASLAQLSRFAGLPGFSADPNGNKVNFKGQTFGNMDQLHQSLYDDYARQVSDPSQISEAGIRQAMSAATAAPGDSSSDPMFGAGLKPFSLQDFQQSPAYQFNLQQGQMAIDKAAASRGKFYAPSTLQDISKYSQGLASNEYQNAFSNYNTNLNNIWQRLGGLSGAGQNAAAGIGGLGSQTAGQVGSNIMGAGNAQAAGQVGQANAFNNTLGNAYNQYTMQQILAMNQGSSVPTAQAGVPTSAGNFNENMA